MGTATSAVSIVAGVLLAAARLQAGWMGGLGAAALAMVFAGLGTAMALGLRALAGWARHLQVATAAIGLLVCPITLASATVLLYMTRPEVRAAFEGSGADPGGDSAEPTFAISLVGIAAAGAGGDGDRDSGDLGATGDGGNGRRLPGAPKPPPRPPAWLSLTQGVIHSKKGVSPGGRRGGKPTG